MLPYASITATDVNTLATSKTAKLLRENGQQRVNVVAGDLFTPFTPSTQFDLIIFNPPYVPTDQLELERALTEKDIAASWAGGEDGRVVIDAFLSSAPSYLSKCGFIYLVALQANDPSQISTFASERGLKATILQRRQAGMETLYVIRFEKGS